MRVRRWRDMPTPSFRFLRIRNRLTRIAMRFTCLRGVCNLQSDNAYAARRSMTAPVATSRVCGWTEPFTSPRRPRPKRSACRSYASEFTARVTHVHGAPPGVYQHTPHTGLAVYMAMSRKVGSIDVGEGVMPMQAQAGDFIVSAQGAAALMHSFRGGHWVEVVLADATLGADVRDRWQRRHFACLPQPSFHRERQVSDLIVQIVRHGLSANAPEPLQLDALGCALADALERFFTSEDRRVREVSPLSKRSVAEILDYMDAHISVPISLSDLGGIVGFPPTRFAKAFRNATGKSPYQALIRRRLEAARFALMTGDGRISEISLSCGFSSQQHMTALFSSRFGIAPGAFRKQIRAS